MLFGAALPNFGVRRLLMPCARWPRRPRRALRQPGIERPFEAPFSGLVFKVQANMNPAHRDRVAFVRVALAASSAAWC